MRRSAQPRTERGGRYTPPIQSTAQRQPPEQHNGSVVVRMRRTRFTVSPPAVGGDLSGRAAMLATLRLSSWPVRTAQHDSIDAGLFCSRVAFHQHFDRDGCKVIGPDGGKRSAETTDRRSNHVANQSVCHDGWIRSRRPEAMQCSAGQSGAADG